MDSVLAEVKNITTSLSADDYTETIIFNSFSCFLEEFINPTHVETLMNHWKIADDEDWSEELLRYLAKVQVDEPDVINAMIAKTQLKF